MRVLIKYNQRMNLIRISILEAYASPSFIISHKLLLEGAPDAYELFDARDIGWTKVVLKPAA